MSETQLTIEVSGADAEDRLLAAADLSAQLAPLPGVTVRSSDLNLRPDGTRGFDASTVGTVIAALTGRGLLSATIGVVRVWLENRTQQVTIKLGDDELTLRGGDIDSQADIIKAFLRRHEERPPP